MSLPEEIFTNNPEFESVIIEQCYRDYLDTYIDGIDFPRKPVQAVNGGVEMSSVERLLHIPFWQWYYDKLLTPSDRPVLMLGVGNGIKEFVGIATMGKKIQRPILVADLDLLPIQDSLHMIPQEQLNEVILEQVDARNFQQIKYLLEKYNPDMTSIFNLLIMLNPLEQHQLLNTLFSHQIDVAIVNPSPEHIKYLSNYTDEMIKLVAERRRREELFNTKRAFNENIGLDNIAVQYGTNLHLDYPLFPHELYSGTSIGRDKVTVSRHTFRDSPFIKSDTGIISLTMAYYIQILNDRT